MRQTKSGVIGVLGICAVCGWTDERRGALGRAALHHDRTGHEVHIETTTVVIYGSREATLAAQGQQRMELGDG